MRGFFRALAKLDTLPSYRPALDALRTLKGTLGPTPEIKAIAAYLIESSEGEIGRSGFPYVGDPTDPRDRAVVEAHQDYWRRFMDGEELEESWREL